MKYIKASVSDSIGVITFGNDKKRNALSYSMINELIKAFNELKYKDARVIILRSNSKAKVWSAGLDISELPAPGKNPMGLNHPLEKLLRLIEDIEIPVIAMITGTVWGGAFELAITCDIVIGTPACSFAITPAKMGVAYNASGLQHFLNIMNLNIVRELFFTAEPIDAKRAYKVGIINNLINEDDIQEYTFKMAQKIVLNSPLSIGIIKKQLNLLKKPTPLTINIFEEINELRKSSYHSCDYAEGKKAFLEKRCPIFTGN